MGEEIMISAGLNVPDNSGKVRHRVEPTKVKSKKVDTKKAKQSKKIIPNDSKAERKALRKLQEQAKKGAYITMGRQLRRLGVIATLTAVQYLAKHSRKWVTGKEATIGNPFKAATGTYLRESIKGGASKSAVITGTASLIMAEQIFMGKPVDFKAALKDATFYYTFLMTGKFPKSEPCFKCIDPE
jgi:hypothetical protein